jgi:hypothetical protein
MGHVFAKRGFFVWGDGSVSARPPGAGGGPGGHAGKLLL